ncbi:MAG: hypothetical protein KYX69_09305 [Sphingomonas sp.]|uniref:hypothetical protein n=1 Tax=Sphingomonas sp. TaxID=28214 RepID=UPI0026338ED9|nr:hypothetical protein [Sphingomonas sp.]MDK2767902.1 hypothetical protein [Sphingomonas sp.]
MADTSELDALIVRNIGDVEAALLRAYDIGDEVVEAIGSAIRLGLDDTWEVAVEVDDNPPIRFSKRAWLDGQPQSLSGAYHFSLSEKNGAGGETDETWLMTLLGDGPNGSSAVLYLWSDTFHAKRRWKKLLDDQSDLIDRLLDAGFRQDSDQWLYLPVAIDGEALANGFEIGDLSAAMAPVTDALGIIQSGMPDIEALIERNRTFD